jgi:hypothetical protein
VWALVFGGGSNKRISMVSCCAEEKTQCEQMVLKPRFMIKVYLYFFGILFVSASVDNNQRIFAPPSLT